jgi:hypothetical protein
LAFSTVRSTLTPTSGRAEAPFGQLDPGVLGRVELHELRGLGRGLGVEVAHRRPLDALGVGVGARALLQVVGEAQEALAQAGAGAGGGAPVRLPVEVAIRAVQRAIDLAIDLGLGR